MLDILRNSMLIRIFWGMMSLYLLNISVDTPDRNPQSVPEDLSINDQESIIEVFVEQVLGYENAIKEYDDLDTKKHNQKKLVKLELLAHSHILVRDQQVSTNTFVKQQGFYTGQITTGFTSIDSPPPKA